MPKLEGRLFNGCEIEIMEQKQKINNCIVRIMMKGSRKENNYFFNKSSTYGRHFNGWLGNFSIVICGKTTG